MAKVVVDAGHGGSDPGAVYEGRQEKDDNLALASLVLLLLLLLSDLRIGQQLPRLFKQRTQTLRQVFFHIIGNVIND